MDDNEMRKWTDKDEAELARLTALKTSAKAALWNDIHHALDSWHFGGDEDGQSRLAQAVDAIIENGQALFDAMCEHYTRTPPMVPASAARASVELPECLRPAPPMPECKPSAVVSAGAGGGGGGSGTLGHGG